MIITLLWSECERAAYFSSKHGIPHIRAISATPNIITDSWGSLLNLPSSCSYRNITGIPTWLHAWLERRWKVFVQHSAIVCSFSEINSLNRRGHVLLQLISSVVQIFLPLQTNSAETVGTHSADYSRTQSIERPEHPSYHWYSEDTPEHLYRKEQQQQQRDHSVMLMKCKYHPFIHFSSSYRLQGSVVWCDGVVNSLSWDSGLTLGYFEGWFQVDWITVSRMLLFASCCCGWITVCRRDVG